MKNIVGIKGEKSPSTRVFYNKMLLLEIFSRPVTHEYVSEFSFAFIFCFLLEIRFYRGIIRVHLRNGILFLKKERERE